MTRDQAFLPILMAALAVASLSLMDAFMKSAALAVGALTAAWLRRVADEPGRWTPSALTPELARTEGWTFGAL